MSLEELEAIAMEAGQSPEQAEITALQMLAYAAGTLPHSPEALASAAGGDDAELILVDDEAPTEVLDRAEVVAALAEPSWRLALTDCVNLLKSIADKDPSAAAGYAMRFRELLTKAEQFGS